VYIKPFHKYNFEFSASSTLPVSMIANCPLAIPVGDVSAVNDATFEYVFAIVNPKPVSPVDPTEPVAPVGPVEPVGPVAPVSPVGPVEPTGPVDPVFPVGPVEPTGPVAPVSPVGPVEPTGHLYLCAVFFWLK